MPCTKSNLVKNFRDLIDLLIRCVELKLKMTTEAAKAARAQRAPSRRRHHPPPDQSVALLFCWLVATSTPPSVRATSPGKDAKDGSEHGAFLRHPFYPLGDHRLEVRRHEVPPLPPTAQNRDHAGLQAKATADMPMPFHVYTGPTVKKFDPWPRVWPQVVRGPVVRGVLQQTGLLAYTPFFSQAFMLDFFIFSMYTFLTLIPAGVALAANVWTQRYNALKTAARKLVKTEEVTPPTVNDPIASIG